MTRPTSAPLPLERSPSPGTWPSPSRSTQTAAAQAITLATTAAGSPGPRQFEIVTPPAHGTLSQTTGSGFTTPTVTYTPTAGYTGSDSFTYVARDASSAFPTSGFEPTGTVSIRAAEASVTISGAPASLMAGTSVQLSGVSNQAGGVTWSTTAGTILPSGLLVAPAEPPAGGTLTVRATSVAVPSISAQAVIAITPVPVAQAAPLPTPLPTPPVTTMTRRSKKLLSGLRAGHAGRRVIVGTITTGPKAGRIDVIVSYKRRVLGRCRARVGARKTVSCKIVMKRNYRLSKVRVTVKLSMGRKSVAVRRAFVKA